MNMTYKQKLIDLLKSNDEVKTVMEEYTTYVVSTVWKKSEDLGFRIHRNNVRIIDCSSKEEALGIAISEFKAKEENNGFIFQYEVMLNYSIILQERFIRMYCKNKEINFWINLDGKFVIKKIIIETNNNLDFDSQSEEVYQKIYEALININ